VQCQNDRSQHRNRAEAMAMMKSKLYELELRKRQEAQQKLEDSKTDIGWGHQIRSYVPRPVAHQGSAHQLRGRRHAARARRRPRQVHRSQPEAERPMSKPAFIFDIDGTIIDSMPWHGRSWDVFLGRHGVAYEGETFLRATAGRTGTEIMRELFGPMSDERAWSLVHEKEDVYRELFAPSFTEIAGFRDFARAARAQGIRIACATAGDAKNIALR
jgi:hypothetical protein